MDFAFIRWLGTRVLFSAVVLLVLSGVVFTATEVLPGDVVSAIVGPFAAEETRQAVREQLHLDHPPLERYVDWLRRALVLDFGQTMANRDPVWPLIERRLLNSLTLAGVAAAIIIPVSVLYGALLARFRGGWLDRLLSLTTLVGLSVPEFVLGTILVLVLGVWHPILPALSMIDAQATLPERFKTLILPILTLTPVTLAYMVRAMQSAMSAVLDKEFIEMAHLKGLPRWRVIWRHALPNALVPMVNVFALNIGWLLGGIVVVEVLFQYPGIGRLLLEAVNNQDLTLLQGTAFVLGTAYGLINLLADVTVALLDPRVLRGMMAG